MKPHTAVSGTWLHLDRLSSQEKKKRVEPHTLKKKQKKPPTINNWQVQM